MCGITGLWAPQQPIAAVQSSLAAMTGCLIHRGPDDGGMWVSEQEPLGLGQRRLAILDLSERGKQPMPNDDGSLWITYNGEVYNFREIRQDLIALGFAFSSNSDTEVIVKAYEAWGTASFSRLRGMFAFALWDDRRKELLLVRDRLGIKPLYYYHRDGLLLFASELKALSAHPAYPRALDQRSLGLYLQFGFVPQPATILCDTQQVRPGHWLRFSAGGAVHEECYWDLSKFFVQPAPAAEPAQVEEELESLLAEAFTYRMVSDVPVGVFLSGGVDSSLVAALLARRSGERIHTFTVGFDEPAHDESPWAEAIAAHLGTEHTTLRCTSREALEIVPKLADIYDEPFADNSAIPTFLLSKAVREHVKVVLSGDGGDEFFCGYNTYPKFAALWSRLAALPRPFKGPLATAVKPLHGRTVEAAGVGMLRTLLPSIDRSDLRDKAQKLPELLAAPDFLAAYSAFAGKTPGAELRHLAPGLQPGYLFDGLAAIDGDPWKTMMLADAKTFLPGDYLVKVDRASMAASLEVRDPMLDHKLVEYASGLPLQYKYADGTGKAILRKILYRYVPRELVDRPKRGFSVPLAQWLRGPLQPLVRDYLSRDRIQREGVLAADAVEKVASDFLAGAPIGSKKIWTLLMFELWWERWLPSRG